MPSETIDRAIWRLRTKAWTFRLRRWLSAVWDALNRPFVLLVLSGVVLAGLSERHAVDKETAEFKAARRIELVSLHSEIALREAELARVAQALDLSRKLPTREKTTLADHAAAVVKGVPPYVASTEDYTGARLEALIHRYEVTAGLDPTSMVLQELDALARGGASAIKALQQERLLGRWVAFMGHEFALGELPISLANRGRRHEVLCDYRAFVRTPGADDGFLHDRVVARKKARRALASGSLADDCAADPRLAGRS